MKYKLSIVICTYNNDWSIERCLNSIPKRDDIQIIIMNDCSTDKTDEKIKNYISNNEDRSIRYLIHKKNAGIGAARKTAQQFVEGDYFGYIGADDWFFPDKVEYIINNYLNKDYDIVYFNMSRNTGYKTKIMTEKNYRSFCGSVKFIKTEFIKNNNIVWHGIRCGEDLDFDRQYWALKPSMVFTNIIAKHWNRPNEKMSNITVHGAKRLGQIRDKILDYYKEHNAKIVKYIERLSKYSVNDRYLRSYKPEYNEESSEYILIK